MTAPTSAPAPSLPSVPKTTPLWVVHLAALLVLLAGPALAFMGKYGILVNLRTVDAQVAIILAFLVAAFLIFTVSVVIENVHKYGWTKLAASQIGTEEVAEFKALLAEGKATLADAPDLLTELKATVPAAKSVADHVSSLEQNLAAAAPAPGRAAIKAALADLLGGESIVTTGGVVDLKASESQESAPSQAIAASSSQPAQATSSTPLPASPAPASTDPVAAEAPLTAPPTAQPPAA